MLVFRAKRIVSLVLIVSLLLAFFPNYVGADEINSYQTDDVKVTFEVKGIVGFVHTDGSNHNKYRRH